MPSRHLYEFGPFRLDTAEQQLLRDGEAVPLTPKAFETLVALLQRRGRLAGKDELMKAVWSDSFVEESNLTNNIYALRKVLGEAEDGRSYIETVPKRGYRFSAPVRELSPDAVVVEKRTITRIVTEVDGAEPSEEIVALAGGRHWRRNLPRTVGAIAVVAIAAYGGFWLIGNSAQTAAEPTGAPFATIDISRITTSGNITHAAVSADGKYLAHVVRDATGNSLWVKHLDAPSTVRVAGPAMTEYLGVTFAPDRKSVYFIALDHDKGETTLYRVPVVGGPSQVVSTDIFAIGFSPDGTAMSFIRIRGSESAVIVANADGSNARVVATRQKPDLFEQEWNAPAWSPDGKILAVPARLNDERGRYATVVGVDLVSGRQTPLTALRWSYAAQAVWLPDGSGLLASASAEAGSPMQVWHIRRDDGIATRVTRDLHNYRGLSLTRDGSRLVALQNQSVSNILVTDRLGEGAMRQVRSEAGTLETISWTRDGRIAFRSSAGGRGRDIWTVHPDGSNARQLTVGARVAQGLASTPDGRHMVFSSEVTDRSHVWRVDTDGGNLRQLTDGNGEFFPQVTPDGRWVVYQADLSIDPRLWKVPIDGGRPVQLTTTRASKPALSPDGRMIAYSYLDLGQKPSRWGVAIISSDGGPILRRFDFPPSVENRFVRWSPDGRSIAFVNTVSGESEIWLQPLDERPARRLTAVSGEPIETFEWSPDGRSLAVVRTLVTSDAVMLRLR